MSDENVIHTQTAEVYRLNEKVIVLRFKTDILGDLENAIEIDEALVHLANNVKHYFIIDALNITSNLKPEALKYFAQRSMVANFSNGAGILINNLPIRLTATAFIKFYKPNYPTKIFASQNEAIEWFEKLEG